LALQEFYRTTGGINLCGRHSHWEEADYPDALTILPIQIAAQDFETVFITSREERSLSMDKYGGFYFVISPDYYHKEQVSGGRPYGIVVPSEHHDPKVEGLPWDLRFTEYLEFALSKGGFPGLGVLR
jgi:hypothetical protein